MMRLHMLVMNDEMQAGVPFRHVGRALHNHWHDNGRTSGAVADGDAHLNDKLLR
jgi:hypothetical protein